MSASMAGTAGNVPLYQQTPKLVEEYYATLIAAAPALAADGYTLDLCQQDFSLALVPLYFGCCCAIGPMFFELPLDNGLWPFLEVWMPRMAESMKVMGCLEAMEKVAATI